MGINQISRPVKGKNFLCLPGPSNISRSIEPHLSRPIDREDGGSGGLEMGEDKKSYLHFFKETLIIKLVIFRPANKGAALLQVDQGKRRI